MKDKEYHVANFATFVSKTLVFSPKKWMNLISNQLSTASIKYLNWPSPVFGRFQNGCNKVVIEPCAVQFWSEIILVISNRTRAMRSVDFEITRMPLFITLSHQWKSSVNITRNYPRSLLEYSQHVRLYEHTYIYISLHVYMYKYEYLLYMYVDWSR